MYTLFICSNYSYKSNICRHPLFIALKFQRVNLIEYFIYLMLARVNVVVKLTCKHISCPDSWGAATLRPRVSLALRAVTALLSDEGNTATLTLPGAIRDLYTKNRLYWIFIYAIYR